MEDRALEGRGEERTHVRLKVQRPFFPSLQGTPEAWSGSWWVPIWRVKVAGWID